MCGTTKLLLHQFRVKRALSLYNDVLLRTRRVLSLCKSVLLKTRRALLLYRVYGNSALLVLNGTSLNINALLVLNWQFAKSLMKLQWKRVWVALNIGLFMYLLVCIILFGQLVSCRSASRNLYKNLLGWKQSYSSWMLCAGALQCHSTRL